MGGGEKNSKILRSAASVRPRSMRLSRSPQELSNGWFQTGHAFPLFRPSDSRADTPVITGPRVTNVNDFSRWRKIVLIFKSFQCNSLDIERSMALNIQSPAKLKADPGRFLVEFKFHLCGFHEFVIRSRQLMETLIDQAASTAKKCSEMLSHWRAIHFNQITIKLTVIRELI